MGDAPQAMSSSMWRNADMECAFAVKKMNVGTSNRWPTSEAHHAKPSAMIHETGWGPRSQEGSTSSNHERVSLMVSSSWAKWDMPGASCATTSEEVPGTETYRIGGLSTCVRSPSSWFKARFGRLPAISSVMTKVKVKPWGMRRLAKVIQGLMWPSAGMVSTTMFGMISRLFCVGVSVWWVWVCGVFRVCKFIGRELNTTIDSCVTWGVCVRVRVWHLKAINSSNLLCANYS